MNNLRHFEERSDVGIHLYFGCSKDGLLRFARNDVEGNAL